MRPARAAALGAVVDEDGDDLHRQAEIAVNAQKRFELLRGQDSAEPPLRLADHCGELRICLIFVRNVALCVDRRCGGNCACGIRLGIQPRLAQARRRVIHLPRGEAQRLRRLFRLAAGVQIEVQQRRVRARRRQKPPHVLRGNVQLLFQHVRSPPPSQSADFYGLTLYHKCRPAARRHLHAPERLFPRSFQIRNETFTIFLKQGLSRRRNLWYTVCGFLCADVCLRKNIAVARRLYGGAPRRRSKWRRRGLSWI